MAIGHSVMDRDLIRIPHSAFRTRAVLPPDLYGAVASWRRCYAMHTVSHVETVRLKEIQSNLVSELSDGWLRRWKVADARSLWIYYTYSASLQVLSPARQSDLNSKSRTQHGAIKLSSCRPDVDNKETTRDFYKSVYDSSLRKTNRGKGIKHF